MNLRKRNGFKLIIILLLNLALLLNSCKKKETIIIEQYNPPELKIYGTWKLINDDPNSSYLKYLIIESQETNYYYSLIKDEYGFKSKQAGTYFATKNTIDFQDDLGRNPYKFNQDTLIIGFNESKYIQVKDSNISYKTWTINIALPSSFYELPPEFDYSNKRTIGINGDYLYFYPNSKPGSNKIYKFNTKTKTYNDSSSSYNYYTGCLYFNNQLYKGEENLEKLKILNSSLNAINGRAGELSTNELNKVTSLSVNTKNNVFYGYSKENKILYSGTSGNDFTEFFNAEDYSLNSIIHFSGDEFIAHKSGSIFKIKLPNFEVIESYSVPNYIYLISPIPGTKEILIFTHTGKLFKLSI